MTESENLADAEQEVTKPLVSAKAVMTAKKKKKKKEDLNQSWVSNKSLHTEYAIAQFADQTVNVSCKVCKWAVLQVWEIWYKSERQS